METRYTRRCVYGEDFKLFSNSCHVYIYSFWHFQFNFSIDELVQDNKNGRLFSNSQQLSHQIQVLVCSCYSYRGYPPPSSCHLYSQFMPHVLLVSSPFLGPLIRCFHSRFLPLSIPSIVLLPTDCLHAYQSWIIWYLNRQIQYTIFCILM